MPLEVADLGEDFGACPSRPIMIVNIAIASS
jgi:hypothetical protein